jgi:RNA polymerase sigma factor (TIGR02999 family)
VPGAGAGGVRMADTDVTQILDAIAAGDRQASERLLPLVYDELRDLAESQMRQEPAGHTLQATALVHEAYLRLVGDGSGSEPKWDSRGHFFSAAARAMRHILVERARRHGRLKRGGDRARLPLDESAAAVGPGDVDLIGLDDALTRLERHNERVAQVVMLRYFAGLGIEDTAAALGIGTTTVKSEWNYARAWLRRAMTEGVGGAGGAGGGG